MMTWMPRVLFAALLFGTLSSAFAQQDQGSPARPELRRVLLLIYDPYVHQGRDRIRLHEYMGWNDPKTLAAEYEAWIESAYPDINYRIAARRTRAAFPRKADGFRYTMRQYLSCVTGDRTACHMPDIADYHRIIESERLCDHLDAGRINEVWMFGGPWFGFWESALAGPDGFPYNSPPLEGTTCGRLLPIMGYNYERGLDSMVHNLGHRTEATMQRIYRSWQQDMLTHNWNRFGLVDIQSPSYSFSGCGSAHYPPNAGREYDYANSDFADTYCDDFYNYPDLSEPTTVLQGVNCEAWGCSELGYFTWWFQHIPAADGIGPDGKYNDWWTYIIDPNTVFATDPVLPTITCSSEYAAAWCQRVLDGAHGVCNQYEWATAGEPTGWVRIAWDTPQALQSIRLYDRARPEQVLGGQLEVEAGGQTYTYPFGPLEDSGTVATELAVDPVSADALTVYIDSAIGGPNPGLGEIELIAQ